MSLTKFMFKDTNSCSGRALVRSKAAGTLVVSATVKIRSQSPQQTV